MRSHLYRLVLLVMFWGVGCTPEREFTSFASPAARALPNVTITSDFQIWVIPNNAHPTTHLAARELQEYLTKSLGAELTIVDIPNFRNGFIAIRNVPDMKPNSFRLRTWGSNFMIEGSDFPGVNRGNDELISRINPMHRGTCNGVYEFLERFVGVRWYWHDDLGEIVPEHTDITIPREFDLEEEPYFEYRTIFGGPVDNMQDSEWGRRQRLGAVRTVYHGHSLHRKVPIEYWANDGHPEYAAWIAGRRRWEPPRAHICLHNPEVINIIRDNIIDRTTTIDGRTGGSLSPPDGSGLCVCTKEVVRGEQGTPNTTFDGCATYVDSDYRIKEFRPRGQEPEMWNRPIYTDMVLEFYRKVSAAVAEINSDVTLFGYIYHQYLYPPKGDSSVPDNMVLVIAPNHALDLWDPFDDTFMEELYSFWGDAHDRTYAYDLCYYGSRNWGFPVGYGDKIRRLFEIYKNGGVDGVYSQQSGIYEMMGATHYQMAKLLWNPDADTETLENEYYQDLYGPASSIIKLFYRWSGSAWGAAVNATEEDIATLKAALHKSHATCQNNLSRVVFGYSKRMWIFDFGIRYAELSTVSSDEDTKSRVARIRDVVDFMRATINAVNAIMAYEQDSDKDPQRLAPYKVAIDIREAVLARMSLYSSNHVASVRFYDSKLSSPLRVNSEYYQIASGQ